MIYTFVNDFAYRIDLDAPSLLAKLMYIIIIATLYKAATLIVVPGLQIFWTGPDGKLMVAKGDEEFEGSAR